MRIDKWISRNTSSLCGKRVAVTGATGGIGRELCDCLARLGAELILMDRNPERSRALGERLCGEYAGLAVSYIRTDLADIRSVSTACDELIRMAPDVIIHNAGAYSIPRCKCETGLDNVFQINFASPYYITKRLLPQLRERGGRVVAVGSIAHRYSETDPLDADFSTRGRASLVYGNAKRYLMLALGELFEGEGSASFSLTHPGITFTGITAHYPRLIFAVIKHPMKVIFMKPRKACLSLLRGVFEPVARGEWIGPAIFDVWGYPKKTLYRSGSDAERARVFADAERIYADMCDVLSDD